MESGYFLCAALAGLVSGVAANQGLTNVEISGFDDAATRTLDFFSDILLDKMADAGIWIVTEDAQGSVHTRHAVTSDPSDNINIREELIRRVLDRVSYDLFGILRPYVGRANANDTLLSQLRAVLNNYMTISTSRNVTATTGPLLISAEIATASDGSQLLRIHPLFKDTIEIFMNIEIAAPANVIQLHIAA